MVFIVIRGVVLVFVYITIVVCVHVFLSMNNIMVNNQQCYVKLQVMRSIRNTTTVSIKITLIVHTQYYNIEWLCMYPMGLNPINVFG